MGKYQDAYNAAAKKGDKAGMAAAHAAADKERGYSTTTTVKNGKYVQTPTGNSNSGSSPSTSSAKSSGGGSTTKSNANSVGKVGSGIVSGTNTPKSGTVSGNAGNVLNKISDKASTLYNLLSNKQPTAGSVSMGTPVKTVATPAPTKTLSDSDQMAANSKAWHTADANTRKQLETDNQALGKKLGLSYNSGAGAWAKPAANVATPKAVTPTVPTAYTTKYTDPSGKEQNGYIINGVTYKDTEGKERIEVGSIVDSKGGKYVLTANGSVPVKPVEEAPATTDAGAIDDVVGTITDYINTAIAADPTLTWEQAFGRAAEQLNGSYNAATSTAMTELDKNALSSGFFGQLPTEALKSNTAASIEVQKQQAINELASSLLGQSETTAKDKLNAATTAQQSKIANMLNLLGVYQSEKATATNNDMNEAALTGKYKGKSTLDFLNYLLDKDVATKKLK